MDCRAVTTAAKEYIQKYRYILLVIVSGIFLMAIPEKEKTNITVPVEQVPAIRQDLQERLGITLSRIDGAGKVEVLLTQKEGERILYQTDEQHSSNASSDDTRKDTVLISGNERTEQGLVSQIIPPTYLGAVVLCQGADRAEIRLAVVEAVMDVTGLTSDRITVLKMK